MRTGIARRCGLRAIAAAIFLGANAMVLGASAMVLGASASAAAPPAKPATGDAFVVILTDRGRIVVDLDAVRAPITTANFLRYVDQKRFDGTTFYRAMHLDWGTQPNGLIQGGSANDPRRVLKPIAHEPTSLTGIHHTAGTISMARFTPGTATGDFTILLSDIAALDADPAATDPDAKAGFAAFGHVVSGIEVARAIWDSPRSPTRGEGVMKGQMIDPPVRIISMRRTTSPPPRESLPPESLPPDSGLDAVVPGAISARSPG